MALGAFEELGDDHLFAIAESMKAGYDARLALRGDQNMEQFNQALQHLEHAYHVLRETEDFSNTVTALSQLAQTHLAVGDYQSALRYAHTLLSRVQQEQDKRDVGRELGGAYGTIGQIHYQARNLDTADHYLMRATPLLEEDAVGQPVIYQALGILRVWGGAPEEALEMYRKALDYVENRPEWPKSYIAHLRVNMAHSCLLAGRLEEAVDHLQTARTLQLKSDHSKAWYNIVMSKLQLASGEVEDAAATMNTIETSIHAVNMKWERIEAEIVLRDIAMAKNDLQGYVRHNDLVTQLTEELRGTKTQQALALVEQEKEIEAERQRTQQEREKERAVLYSALPKAVADRVVAGETVNNDHHDDAAMIFLDIAGFTRLTSSVPPGHVIHLLDAIFNACDDVVERHSVTKIKTIGDSYMAVAFPEEGQPPSAHRAAAAALDLVDAMDALEVTMPEDLGDASWVDEIPSIDVRIGVHIGPVVAGVIGSKRLQYDAWGDTVNMASRMESTGEPGRVQVSDAFARALSLVPRARTESDQAPGTRHFALTKRGEVNVKGKGSVTTYWLERV